LGNGTTAWNPGVNQEQAVLFDACDRFPDNPNQALAGAEPDKHSETEAS
jgi:hypothetical protein